MKEKKEPAVSKTSSESVLPFPIHSSEGTDQRRAPGEPGRAARDDDKGRNPSAPNSRKESAHKDKKAVA